MKTALSKCTVCGAGTPFMVYECEECVRKRSEAPPERTEGKEVAPSVRLTAIDIPFGDLVIFYFKATLAAVPVAFVFAIAYLFLTTMGK